EASRTRTSLGPSSRAAVASSVSRVRPARMSVAPAFDAASATARPMPEPAPTTITRLFSKSMRIPPNEIRNCLIRLQSVLYPSGCNLSIWYLLNREEISMTKERAAKLIAPTGELRDGFKFRSGRLPLDLAATLAFRLRSEPKDLLATPNDLGRWFV